jgi:hypothetical protein
VTQTNAALAGAFAGNLNLTGQSATQSQAGGGGVQAIGQEAKSEQDADAEANAFQLKPSNSNTPVSIGGGHEKKHGCGCDDGKDGGYGHGMSGGSAGDVTQTNLAGALGIALNLNATEQTASQTQGGGYDCKCGHGGTQAIGQSAWNDQDADADANAFQLFPSNSNAPVRIGSPGNGGSVRQTNAALAFALAANLNLLEQEATQTQ